MKRYNIMMLVAFLMLFMLVSCEEDVTDNVGQISEVMPSEAYPRESIVLKGSNFGDVQYVFFRELSVEFTNSGNEIKFDIPHGSVSGEGKITLAYMNNLRVTASVLVKPSADPIFTSITSTAAMPGSNVTITGSSLGQATEVSINGTAASIVSNSDTELTFSVPSGVTDSKGQIKVVTVAGENTTEYTFYVGKEVLVDDFDGNGFGGWGSMGGAVDTEVSGIQNASPTPISGNFFKMVGAAGSWGGSQIEATGGFGLTAAKENILLVVDVNNNGTECNYRFNVQDNKANFWSSYQGVYNGWTTLEIPLTEFGWQYNGDGSTQSVNGQAVDPTILNVVKVQWGSPVVEGGEISFDNVRFIELAN
ncbi:glycan-binding surface protein [Limibacter armeniacum]|uniref:IPT/TIG domain-containing protein n=1 Tax=Limibacter armeniacum TaxID=466084 RepID=UPI002FE68958